MRINTRYFDKDRLFIIANGVLFQIGWFVCILYGGWRAGLFTLGVLVFHFYLSSMRGKDVLALVVAVAIGLTHDFLLIYAGHIRFTETNHMPPFGIICLWALLGINLNHSLRWIYARPLLSSLVGAVSGPCTYVAGVKLSAAEWSSPLLEVLPIIGALWLFILPLHRFLCLRILSYVHVNKFFHPR